MKSADPTNPVNSATRRVMNAIVRPALGASLGTLVAGMGLATVGCGNANSPEAPTATAESVGMVPASATSTASSPPPPVGMVPTPSAGGPTAVGMVPAPTASSAPVVGLVPGRHRPTRLGSCPRRGSHRVSERPFKELQRRGPCGPRGGAPTYRSALVMQRSLGRFVPG